MAEENKTTTNTAAETAAPAEKESKSDGIIEVLVAIFLGITALLTAWASWIGSLHGGNQATNYTESNNLATEGNSMYNEAMQNYLSDLMVWNTYNEYYYDLDIANINGNEEEAALIQEKIDNYIADNGTEILIEAMETMQAEEGKYNTPFEVEGMTDKYYADAEDKIALAEEKLEQGKRDNGNGDRFNLVNVIYSIVLFMLGIVGIFKHLPCRAAVLVIAVVGLIATTIFMLTIPMPTGFDFMSYFSHG